MIRATKKCPYCGKEFRNYSRCSQIYCSFKCFQENLRQRSRNNYRQATPEEKKLRCQKDREKRSKLRYIIITHYSGNPPKCQCCGESIYDFLTINHKNGGGHEEHKITNYMEFYRSIIENNFPDTFNILCMNCNYGSYRSIDKICPHKKVEMK
jgi:hypothetical protein